ncbi:MAG: hypothetical protein RLY86_1944 [Pseudomonadota bacterium]
MPDPATLPGPPSPSADGGPGCAGPGCAGPGPSAGAGWGRVCRGVGIGGGVLLALIPAALVRDWPWDGGLLGALRQARLLGLSIPDVWTIGVVAVALGLWRAR